MSNSVFCVGYGFCLKGRNVKQKNQKNLKKNKRDRTE